mmetsp:Transcript_12936/g.18881  ORF Transcript_12936/g.18881 Transcript_12936/m.18881 type:complete len:107 (+) Transcript_12936:262-582(+)
MEYEDLHSRVFEVESLINQNQNHYQRKLSIHQNLVNKTQNFSSKFFEKLNWIKSNRETHFSEYFGKLESQVKVKMSKKLEKKKQEIKEQKEREKSKKILSLHTKYK